MEEEHGGDGDSASAAETDGTSGMSSASSDSYEQFRRFLRQEEGYYGTIQKNSEGVECYQVGDGAVGYGVDIATFGSELTSKGYSIETNALIPVDVVDAMEKRELDGHIESVTNITSNAGIKLTEYQIYALTSRSYNYGETGGTGHDTSSWIYPSNYNFVEAYKKYYANVDNSKYYGDYSKTDFNQGLWTNYMTWLDYGPSFGSGYYGTHPAGWETRRKAEWCLFQTGYYGWGLKNGNQYPVGFDEYWQESYGTSGTGGSAIASSGDGYDQVYKSSTGRTYKDYEQWKGKYSIIPFFGGTIEDSGCSITSVATILTGYGKNVTPGDLAGYTYMITAFKNYGLNCSSGFEGIDKKKLTSGKPALVNISGTLVTENGSKYYGGHFIAVLDGRVKNGKYQVYVSDPGANNSQCGGWTDVDNLSGILGPSKVVYIYD